MAKQLILQKSVRRKNIAISPNKCPFGTPELPKILLPIREWELTFFREWDQYGDFRRSLFLIASLFLIYEYLDKYDTHSVKFHFSDLSQSVFRINEIVPPLPKILNAGPI